jgi:CRISPR/Cas system endoribonuclease Cas6 (RAMP superfamily)
MKQYKNRYAVEWSLLSSVQQTLLESVVKTRSRERSSLTMFRFHTLLYTNHMHPNNVNNTSFIFIISQCGIMYFILVVYLNVKQCQSYQTANIRVKHVLANNVAVEQQ